MTTSASPAMPSPSTATSTTPATTKISLSAEELTAYLSNPQLNHTFQLPADPSCGRPDPFQIAYADFGQQRQEDAGDDAHETVLLFFGALMSSRLLHAAKDGLAKKYKVRIINVERPGIGKTDDMPAEKMLEIWREAMPALLNHLGIERVSVGCHSAGTVYGLDFALHNAHFLDPSRPYVAIAGPWIHCSHTGVLTMSMASLLPRSLVAQAGNVVSFVNSHLGPVLGVSAAVSGSVAQLWSSPPSATGREGPDVAFEEGVRDRVVERVFRGNVRGLGQEVQMLLRCGPAFDNGWADWGDYDALAPRLAAAVRAAGATAKLRLEMFYAEKDVMVGDMGTKGPKWFDACWTDVDGVDYVSETVLGADHDHAWDLRWDVMERVFKRMTEEA